MTTKKNKTTAGRRSERSNQVRLVGTLSDAPELRVLPSGTELAVCRLVVRRDVVRRRGDGKPGPSVDVIDCAAWDARPRRALAGWSAGDEVEVSGALRRRFFRAGGQTMSRVEVEVSGGRVLRRAAVE